MGGMIKDTFLQMLIKPSNPSSKSTSDIICSIDDDNNQLKHNK